MLKILISISVLVCIISFSSINCTSNENQLTKLENELLDGIILSLRFSAEERIQADEDLQMYTQLKLLSDEISSSAYAMVLKPDGSIFVHNIPAKMNKKLDDEATKKVLENRDYSEVLTQKLKLDNRDVIELSLPVFSSFNSGEYIGAVRFAIYLN